MIIPAILDYIKKEFYDLQQLSYSGLSFDVSAVTVSSGDLRVSGDETRFYLSERTDSLNGFVNQFTMTPGDISSAVLEYTLSLGAGSRVEGICFNGDGTVFYWLPGSGSTGTLRSGTCSTPWDLQTVSAFGSVALPSLTGSVGESLWVHPDGTYVGVLTEGLTIDGLNLYLMATPNNISTIGLVGFKDIDAITASVIESIDIKPDGTKLYALNTSSYRIYELTFGTPWDPSSLTVTDSILLSSLDNTPSAFCFNASGSRAYYHGTNTDTIYQLDHA